MIERLNHQQHISHVEIQDLSLEDVYKDFVRGQKS